MINSKSEIDKVQRKDNINKYDMYIFYIVIFDILFLPYVRILNSSISMLILPLWYILKLSKINVTKEIRLFFVMLFFVLISLVLSFIRFPQYLVNNIYSFIILLYGFLFYFYFEWNLKRNHKSLQKFLIIYISFVFFLSIVYFVNPTIYFYLRSFWTMSGNAIEVNSSLLIHRFTSTFSDPNNLAIIINTILLYLFTNIKLSNFQSITLIGMTAFILFMAMSSTGFVLFGLFLLVLLFFKLMDFFRRPVIKKRSLILLLFLLILLPFIYLGVDNFLNSEVAQLSLYRFQNSEISSRTTRWETLLKSKNIFYSLILGDGGTVIVNGTLYKPHNGHFHLIYNYSFIAYFIFMYIFFRIRKPFSSYKKALFLLPLFLGFTMNVGIYEPRFINIMALLVGSYSTISTQNFKEKKEAICRKKW